MEVKVTGSGIIEKMSKRKCRCRCCFFIFESLSLSISDPSRDESKNWKLTTSLEKFLPVQKNSVPLATAFSSYLRSQNS